MISIIIPNLHSPIIDKTLNSINNQECDWSYEIIVIGQDRFNLIDESNNTKFIRTSFPVSPAIARNIGIRNSRGEILVFLDSDCIAHQGWLRTLIQRYQDPKVMVVGGGVDFPKDNFLTYCDNLATFHDYLSSLKPGVRRILPTLNISIRREAQNSVGFFDEGYPLPAGEDADYSTRLRISGHTLYFEPRAAISHLPSRRGFISILLHSYNFGRYSVKIDPRYTKFLDTPFILMNPLLIILLSPIIAFSVVLRIIRDTHFLDISLFALPIVYFLKIIWCFGAAHTLIASNHHE